MPLWDDLRYNCFVKIEYLYLVKEVLEDWEHKQIILVILR